MPILSTVTFHNYLGDGGYHSSETISTLSLDPEVIERFKRKLSHLPADLELPLECSLPGSFQQLDYRMGSDGCGAFVMYYFHDEVIFASLMLPGIDDQLEYELAQVFRFVLIDRQDEVEPTEDEIEEVLESSDFDFIRFSERPVVYTITFAERTDEAEVLTHIATMNHHLAAAFFRKRLGEGMELGVG